MHDSEAPRVAVRPLEIVQEAPDEVAAQKLREQITLAFYYVRASGSVHEAEELLAQLTPEQLSSPRGIQFRKSLAYWKDDYAEYKRLDTLQPFFENDASDAFEQAEGAAEE